MELPCRTPPPPPRNSGAQSACGAGLGEGGEAAYSPEELEARQSKTSLGQPTTWDRNLHPVTCHIPLWLLRPNTSLPLGMFRQLLTCPAGGGAAP